MRWLLSFVVFANALAWSAEASACKCGGDFALPSTSERLGLSPSDGVTVDDQLLVDPDSPIVIMQAREYEQLPEVYFKGERLEYDVERVESDESCTNDFLALDIAAELKEGDELTVVSPDRVAQAEYISDPSAVETELTVRVGPPRKDVATTLTIGVEWTLVPPFPLSDALCPSNVLLPYEGQGEAVVSITSPDEVEYYARTSVVLPGGETYREAQMSRYVLEYSEERVPFVRSGSRGDWRVPLTNSSEDAECIHLTVFDHRLAPVFDEDVCPDDVAADPPHTSLSLDVTTASLNELPEDALQPKPEENSGKSGCTFSPSTNNRLFVWLLLALAASVFTRKSSRSK